MKTDNKELKPARLLMPSNLGSGKITRELVEAYIAHGRYLQSLYVVGLLRKLGRWPITALSRFTRRLGRIFYHTHVTAREIAAREKGEIFRHRH